MELDAARLREFCPQRQSHHHSPELLVVLLRYSDDTRDRPDGQWYRELGIKVGSLLRRQGSDVLAHARFDFLLSPTIHVRSTERRAYEIAQSRVLWRIHHQDVPALGLAS